MSIISSFNQVYTIYIQKKLRQFCYFISINHQFLLLILLPRHLAVGLHYLVPLLLHRRFLRLLHLLLLPLLLLLVRHFHRRFLLLNEILNKKRSYNEQLFTIHSLQFFFIIQSSQSFPLEKEKIPITNTSLCGSQSHLNLFFRFQKRSITLNKS